jgi:hypothetical protein
MILSPVHSVLAVALLLSACTTTNGMSNQTATGALIGGVTGAALGNAIGDSDRATIAGGLAGAVIGGAIGENLARQERELNQQLDGSGAQITNTGNQLMVVLPEGVTFPTGSARGQPRLSARTAPDCAIAAELPELDRPCRGPHRQRGNHGLQQRVEPGPRPSGGAHPDQLRCAVEPDHLFRSRLCRTGRLE